jgi:hypothetical protein
VRGDIYDEPPVLSPPDTFTVEFERKPVLYLPDGRVLVKRPAGFRTDTESVRRKS